VLADDHNFDMNIHPKKLGPIGVSNYLLSSYTSDEYVHV